MGLRLTYEAEIERTMFWLYALTNRRDTAGLPPQACHGVTNPYGCPMFAPAYVGRKRRAKPTIAFGSGSSRLLIRTEAHRSGGICNAPGALSNPPWETNSYKFSENQK
jgi:hypothetical protein